MQVIALHVADEQTIEVELVDVTVAVAQVLQVLTVDDISSPKC
jgi:hypothetical protein